MVLYFQIYTGVVKIEHQISNLNKHAVKNDPVEIRHLLMFNFDGFLV